MTISQLMAQLAALQEQYGDIPVQVGYTYCADDEEYNAYAPIRFARHMPFDTSRAYLGTDIIVEETDDDWDE